MRPVDAVEAVAIAEESPLHLDGIADSDEQRPEYAFVGDDARAHVRRNANVKP